MSVMKEKGVTRRGQRPQGCLSTFSLPQTPIHLLTGGLESESRGLWTNAIQFNLLSDACSVTSLPESPLLWGPGCYLPRKTALILSLFLL